MTYGTYNEEGRRHQAHDAARAVAAELCSFWEWREDVNLCHEESRLNPHPIITKVGAEPPRKTEHLFFFVDYFTPQPRWEVRGEWPYLESEDGQRPGERMYPGKNKPKPITQTFSRPVDKLARDIERRYLDGYIKEYYRLALIKEEIDTENADKRELLEKLAVTLGTKLTDWERERFEFHHDIERVTLGQLVSQRVEVGIKTSESVTISLNSLNPQEAADLCELIVGGEL